MPSIGDHMRHKLLLRHIGCRPPPARRLRHKKKATNTSVVMRVVTSNHIATKK